MEARSKAVLLAFGLVLLALASVPTAEASGFSRGLKQWSLYGDYWGSPYWGGYGGWWGQRWSDPVGSGCWDGDTSIRYRNGETMWCSGGGRRRCNWGTWEGSCYSSSTDDFWTRKKSK